MEARTLGRTTLEVSAIGLGCNNFGLRTNLEQTRAVVDKAIDLGVTLFDTADRYGSPPGSSGRTTRAPPRSYRSGCGSWQKTTTSCPRRAHSRAIACV